MHQTHPFPLLIPPRQYRTWLIDLANQSNSTPDQPEFKVRWLSRFGCTAQEIKVILEGAEGTRTEVLLSLMERQEQDWRRRVEEAERERGKVGYEKGAKAKSIQRPNLRLIPQL
jgi:hypothetical protein